MKESINKLLGLTSGNQRKNTDKVQDIKVEQIDPSPYQPRTHFADDALEELCQTIKTHGIIQPIITREVGNRLQLIAGERRLRAAKKLNMETIPTIVITANDKQAAAMALIENLQREDLSPIEEAFAYKKIISEHSITQEALAQRLGKSQSTIANKLRLLQLPDSIQSGLNERKITERHARELLRLQNKEQLQAEVYFEVLNQELTVGTLEKYIDGLLFANKELKQSAVKKPNKANLSGRGKLKNLNIVKKTLTESVALIQNIGIDIKIKELETDDEIEYLIIVKKQH